MKAVTALAVKFSDEEGRVMSETTAIIPAREWTNGGKEVLLLKCVNKDGKSHGGFQWPLTVGASVEAPDWDPKPECGHGLHGWPWGLSMGEGRDPDWAGAWLVFGAAPADIVDLGGKVKAKCGVIRFVGSWWEATAFVLSGQMAWVSQAAQGAASSTGYAGAASSTGTRGAASSTGDAGAASSTGTRGAASSAGTRGAASSTGYAGAASSTGYAGAASSAGTRGAASSAGTRGAASSTGYAGAASSTGDAGAASSTGTRGAASSTGYAGAASSTGYAGAASSTGVDGRVRGGVWGCVALAYYNKRADRVEMRCARIGNGDGKDDHLKADTWYVLNGKGEFIEASE